MSYRILVVGAGAVGGYFGARLATAGRDVTFLVRQRRAEQLRRSGLEVTSPHGNLHIVPRLVGAGEMDGPYDLVLLSVKAYALEGVLADLAPALGPDSVLLPALNGMQHIERLRSVFGDAVLGGTCRIVAHLDEAGRIVQANPTHSLTYGELDGKDTPRIRAADAALRGAGFDTHLSADTNHDMWEKWVSLASLGGITCLFGGSIGAVAAVPGGTEVAVALVEEALAVSAACGHPHGEAFAARVKGSMTAAGSPLTSSMYRDRQDGGRVEVEQIIGDMVEQGGRHGVPTPLLRAAAVSLRVYEAGLPGAGRG